MKKNNGKYIIVFVILIILSITTIVVSNTLNKDGANIKIEDEKNLLSSFNKEDQEQLKSKTRKYLSDKKFGEYSTIKFIEKITANNYDYFYFSINDETNILFELSYINNKLQINYMGNSVTNDTKSNNTGYTYLQIMDPNEYKKQQELNEIIEEGEKSKVDSDYNVEIDPKYGYSID